MSDPLLSLAAARGGGRASSLTSVCSAHPLVLEAALRHAASRDSTVLIEATCNQVNQDGGYTGLTPAAFRSQIVTMATVCGLRPELLLLGGDHLGPNPWTRLPAEAALAKAEAMVAAYVAAGFRKLHLDTSMACADDPASLEESVIAARAARLGRVAEATASQHGLPTPLYVVGTEVPPPGGAREHIGNLAVTSPQAAESTIRAHARAFAQAGLQAATERVIAIVVQPGVEFGTENVVAYDPEAAVALIGVLDQYPSLVFEAHSTDYQTPACLHALAQDGFGVLKVGPGLTFALREALYRLDALDAVLRPETGVTRLPKVMEQAMQADPSHWQRHYQGDSRQTHLARHYSYSDRIRYYWPKADVVTSVEALLERVRGIDVPETLISQHFPMFIERVRKHLLPVDPRALLMAAVTDVLHTYEPDGP